MIIASLDLFNLRSELHQLGVEIEAARRMLREIEVNAPAGNAGRRIKESATAASRRLASAVARVDALREGVNEIGKPS